MILSFKSPTFTTPTSTNADCMTKSMWTAKYYSNVWFLKVFLKFQNVLLSAALTAFTLNGFRLYHQILEPDCGCLLTFSHISISRVQHWCCVISPVLQSASQFILKLLDGVEFRALCRSDMFFSHQTGVLYGPGFVYGVIVMVKQESST